MSNFNSKTLPKKADVVNLAGGAAYSQSRELELVSLLLTSFAQDQYYRTAEDTFKRLAQLIKDCDKEFVARALIYARTVIGMRSITHVGAAELAKYIGGKTWAASFYQAIVYRPDDMTEILSYYSTHNAETNAKGKKKFPNALKRGFASALEALSPYQLAKYRGEGKGFKLVDVVNLVHPKYTEGLTQLVKGTLKSTETWEAKLSAAGKDGNAKAEVWIELIKEKKLGYLALLRNLRNIMEQAPLVIDEALASLTNPVFIKNQLIFPFQYLIAYKQFLAINTPIARKIAYALSQAIEISCANVKELGFDEDTLVAVDNSGSMTAPVAKSGHMKCSELGALFGIVLGKAINADVLEFGTTARYIHYSLNENCMSFAASFAGKNKVGHGTNFHSIFDIANKKYKRIIIFSDMQGWMYGGAPTLNFKAWKNRYEANPFIYSFDLAGYGSLQFPEDKTFCLAGFSDKILTIMSYLEKDKKALINEINKVTF